MFGTGGGGLVSWKGSVPVVRWVLTLVLLTRRTLATKIAKLKPNNPPIPSSRTAATTSWPAAWWTRPGTAWWRTCGERTKRFRLVEIKITPPPGIEPVRAVTSNAGNAPVPNTYAGNAPWLNTYNAHTPTPLDLPTDNHAYWAGPVALQDAPAPYRACVCALALKTFVAPTVLHACVRQVDFAFTARERFLEKEFVEFKKRALIERKETRARLGKKPMGKRSKK